MLNIHALSRGSNLEVVWGAMEIAIRVSKQELKDMLCDDVAGFEKFMRHQLDRGVVGDDGEVGADWMVDYDLNIVVEDPTS